jgi:hypothetical protein
MRREEKLRQDLLTAYFSVRPRESGDPEIDSWFPAYAGMNGENARAGPMIDKEARYFFIFFARNSCVRFHARSVASLRKLGRSSFEKACGASG